MAVRTDALPGHSASASTSAISPPEATTPSQGTRRRWHLGMRWKLLLAFGLGVSLVFVVVATWIVRFSTDTAKNRLTENLRSLSIGGAQTIDAEQFRALTQTGREIVAGELYPANAATLAGTAAVADSAYPTNPAYWDHVNQIANIRLTNPEASPYTYFRGTDGNLEFIGSWSALGYPTMNVDAPIGTLFHQPVSTLVDASTAEYFANGLTETTAQPAYTDRFGHWISVYTPIVAADGTIVGAIGVDYPLEYVDQVQLRVRDALFPVFGAAYVILILLVLYLSHWMTRRLGRLSSATKRVSGGDYEVDLSGAAKAMFPDEMTDLAQSFGVMTEKIRARERSLVRQVQVLKVEIDEAKRQQSVAEITESDFFTSLTAKATALRARVRELDAAEAAGPVDTGPTNSGETAPDSTAQTPRGAPSQADIEETDR
ncbi:MAG: HAMP domain-containing protein [Actinobacteria bacterium]|uniref:histidine kinase n=1 Tax=freshwater metagenome TaxID=449393 RepID=A0A6J5YJK5_9ZZZZ|nr:HAMP domain-containing protein [Actinomycetota bacterium]MTA78054.1 HAMP domain-containing protein [Actinomycetota bacterium]